MLNSSLAFEDQFRMKVTKNQNKMDRIETVGRWLASSRCTQNVCIVFVTTLFLYYLKTMDITSKHSLTLINLGREKGKLGIRPNLPFNLPKKLTPKNR